MAPSNSRWYWWIFSPNHLPQMFNQQHSCYGVISVFWRGSQLWSSDTCQIWIGWRECCCVALHDIGDESVVITGSSTHNERIERLWRDVFRCVSKLFYDTFHSLEEDHLLDPLNETDIFCLHYVYVPIINRCLQEFVESWNHHRISSEHNRTPYQLQVMGSLPSTQLDVNVDDDDTLCIAQDLLIA